MEDYSKQHKNIDICNGPQGRSCRAKKWTTNSVPGVHFLVLQLRPQGSSSAVSCVTNKGYTCLDSKG